MIVLPLAILSIVFHIRYYQKNRGLTLLFNRGVFKVEKNGVFVTGFNKDEIQSVKLFIAANAYKPPTLHLTPLESYFAFEFTLRDGEKYLFSCLMIPYPKQFEKAIPDLSIKKEFGFGGLFKSLS